MWLFAQFHLENDISLVFLTVPATLIVFGDRKTWKGNFRILASWGKKDIEWLAKKPLTAFYENIELPRGGKFNPGQKGWAMVVISGAAILSVTGVVMWTTSSPIFALAVHTLFALILTAGLTGHIYMAFANWGTRPDMMSISER
jgi:cytochrome b subunit of formate dehydrogenase